MRAKRQAHINETHWIIYGGDEEVNINGTLRRGYNHI